MISFPNAKINIGLNVVSKRGDGYHNLETIFYPVQLSDALEFVTSEKIELSNTGIKIGGSPEDNLVIKAYKILAADFSIPPVKFHIHKNIPFGAGLGGGSSDGAFALQMLNKYFNLKLSNVQLEGYASRLGADCSFFIQSLPVFATGIGDRFESIQLNLSDYQIVIVKPDFSVNTAYAYQNIIPARPKYCLKDLVKEPVENWGDLIINDFEKTVFSRFPQIENLKKLLYSLGAVYSSMSGSGSAVYGIFRHLPADFDINLPKGIFIYR